jgi:hypothetical protein
MSTTTEATILLAEEDDATRAFLHENLSAGARATHVLFSDEEIFWRLKRSQTGAQPFDQVLVTVHHLPPAQVRRARPDRPPVTDAREPAHARYTT